MKNYIFMLIVLGFIAFACNKEPIGQQPIDNVPPGPISDVKVENTPGGAIITYSLPQDEDLIYVKAIYSLKDGVQSEVKSSMYTDTLKIAGFGDTQEHPVFLIAVDRSRNESVPVIRTITPLEPPVTTIGATMRLVEDFGGVHAYWDNPNRAEVSVVIVKEDNNNEYVPIQTIYSTMVNGESAQRGMDTIPGNFGLYVQDRWENRSETKYFNLTPLFERQFDRLNFRMVLLPGDQVAYPGHGLALAWDNIFNNYFLSLINTGLWPQSFTVDLGVSGRISRLIYWQYSYEYNLEYDAANIKKFELWGCTTLDATGNWASWTKLGNYVGIKPSGLPLGKVSAEDKAWALAGEEFNCSPLNPKVRYIRLLVTENYNGVDYVYISEFQVFGDNR